MAQHAQHHSGTAHRIDGTRLVGDLAWGTFHCWPSALGTRCQLGGAEKPSRCFEGGLVGTRSLGKASASHTVLRTRVMYGATSGHRRRWLLRAGVAVAALLGAATVRTSRVGAYNLNSCLWSKTSLTYEDALSNTTDIDQAASSWNSSATLRLSRVAPGGGDIIVNRLLPRTGVRQRVGGHGSGRYAMVGPLGSGSLGGSIRVTVLTRPMDLSNEATARMPVLSA